MTTHKLFQRKIIYSYDPNSVIHYKLDMISDIHKSRLIMNLYCSTIIKTSQKPRMRKLQFWNDTKLTKIFSFEIIFCFILKYKVNQYRAPHMHFRHVQCVWHLSGTSLSITQIFDGWTLIYYIYSAVIRPWYFDYGIKHVKLIFIQIFLDII